MNDIATRQKKLLIPKAILGLIALEFIIGTLAGLYQEIPEGLARYDVYKPASLVFFHVIIAASLLVLSIIYIVQSKKQKESQKAFGASVGGSICILLALVSGSLFVETANDIFSLTMMFFALGALLSYAQIVFRKQ